MAVRAADVQSKLEAATGERWPAFHFGLNGANVEDCYAALRFILDTGAKPELILIAQDFRNYNPTMKTDTRLIATPVLYHYLSGKGFSPGIIDELSVIKNMIGFKQTKNSFRSIKHAAKKQPVPMDFGPAGDLKSVGLDFKPVAEPSAQKQLDENFEPYGRFYKYNRLSEKRLKLLEEMYALSNQKGITIVTWNTTVHPALYEQIVDTPALFRVYSDFSKREKKAAMNSGNVAFIDIMNPKSAYCVDKDFSDLTHYSLKCAQAVTDRYLIPSALNKMKNR